MNYQVFEPSETLKAFVKCYWTLEFPAEVNPQKQSIVPDGCVEMIFHQGDLYRQYLNNGESILQPKCFVIGQLTQPLEIEPTGATNIFSVRFHPGGFLPFTLVTIKEMENVALDLTKMFGTDGHEIETKILAVTSTEEKIKLVESFLLNRLLDTETIDRVIKATVETMLTANGQISIDELSQQTNINRRQLERKFSSIVGLSPKTLSKVIRLQSTLKMLLNKDLTSLTALAYEGEYYDQAHFIKDFKEFTGKTPKEFYRHSMKMTALFIGSD